MVFRFLFLIGAPPPRPGLTSLLTLLPLGEIPEMWGERQAKNCQDSCHSNKDRIRTIAESKNSTWNLLHENLLKHFQQKKDFRHF